jgi:hypothetical protein
MILSDKPDKPNKKAQQVLIYFFCGQSHRGVVSFCRTLRLSLRCVFVATPQARRQPAFATRTESFGGTSRRLQEELVRAKKAGDIFRMREVARQLEEAAPPTSEGSDLPQPTRLSDEEIQVFGTPADWGDDIIVRTGNLEFAGEREIAVATNDVGTIFLAANFINGNGSVIIIFRSTNQGRTWSEITNFSYATAKIQSFDMAVADTLNGRYVIGLAWVLRFPTTDIGGSLI